MAIDFDTLPLCGRRLALLATLILPVPVGADLLDDFLVAADQGQCIEGFTFRLIHEHGPGEAPGIVAAAIKAHSQRQHQQRLLGCAGNIAAQAIAAGADPDQVLEATAAGL